MEWTIAVHEDQRYTEIATSGSADREGSLEMARTISTTLTKTQHKRILIDHRNLLSVAGDTTDVYTRPKQFREIGVIPGIKIAEVVKPEHREFFQFLEVVSINRGFDFMVFNDHGSALEWLLK